MVAVWKGAVVKRVIGAFVFIAVFLGLAFAETLSPRAFTEEIANAIRTAVPSAKVWIERELEVEITYSNGQNVLAELAASYNAYRDQPERLRSIIDLHIERLKSDEWAKAQPKIL